MAIPMSAGNTAAEDTPMNRAIGRARSAMTRLEDKVGGLAGKAAPVREKKLPVLKQDSTVLAEVPWPASSPLATSIMDLVARMDALSDQVEVVINEMEI